MKTRILSLFVSLSIFFWLGAIMSPVFAAKDCGLADIKNDTGGQNWDVTYCVSGTYDEIKNIDSVTATCRRGPTKILGESIQNCQCHEQNWYDNLLTAPGARMCGLADGDPFNAPPAAAEDTRFFTVNPNAIAPDPKNPGNYYTCFTITSLDRNMGAIDVKIRSSGKPFCYPARTDVTSKNYSWKEYFQNTLSTRFGIGSEYNPFLKPTCIDGKSVNTALGCIPTDPSTFLSFLLRIGIGIAGGIAFLLILLGGFRILTSTGNPEKLNAGKELVGSAIAGLLLIIFSIFLLRVIGVDILGIPGFK